MFTVALQSEQAHTSHSAQPTVICRVARPGNLPGLSAKSGVDDMQNVSSKFPGVGHPASPEMVGLGDPGAMTLVRPGAHGGAGRGVHILLGGAGRGAQVGAPVRPCPPCS